MMSHFPSVDIGRALVILPALFFLLGTCLGAGATALLWWLL